MTGTASIMLDLPPLSEDSEGEDGEDSAIGPDGEDEASDIGSPDDDGENGDGDASRAVVTRQQRVVYQGPL